MEKTLQLEIPLILPGVEDEKDRCVQRLLERIRTHRGIKKVHIEHQNREALFCLHFDPDHLSIEKLRRIAGQEGAAITSRYWHKIIRITNMGCGDCASSIEHILERINGILNIAVNYAAEKMWVEFDSELITLEEIIRKVKQLGYRVEEEEREKSWLWEHWELALSILSGIFLANGFLGESLLALPQPVAIGFYILAYLAGGYDATRHGIKAALHLRFDIDFLMVVAAIGAAVLGEWAEGALLLFLFSLGHALEHAATDKARQAIRALGEITPKTARVKRNGKELEIAVEKLERGDLVIIKPGELIPVDGNISNGNSAIDESPVTGESVPLEKQEGNKVFAGTINGDGALEVVVTKLAKDTTIARIVRMVEEAQAQKSPTQRFAERFQLIFVPVVLVGVLLVIFLPPLLGWLNWSDAFLRAMSILVAASPCALAIATPAAVLSAIAQAARNGVLIKGGVFLEELGAVKAIAFDKTGTITEGKLRVTDIVPLNIVGSEQLLKLAAAVESRSSHPLAKAIVNKAIEENVEFPHSENLQSFSGIGVQAQVDGKLVMIGNTKLFEREHNDTLPKELTGKV